MFSSGLANSNHSDERYIWEVHMIPQNSVIYMIKYFEMILPKWKNATAYSGFFRLWQDNEVDSDWWLYITSHLVVVGLPRGRPPGLLLVKKCANTIEYNK